MRMTRGWAAGVVAVLLAAGPATGAVWNGGFEDEAGLAGAPGSDDWNVFAAIPGWLATSGPGIELQKGTVGGVLPYEGDYKVELDSHANSAMAQTLDLDAGSYRLSFAYSARVAGDPGDTNAISVSVDGTGFAETISADVIGWTLVERTFSLSTAGSVALRFAAAGRDDSLGGYLDAVMVLPLAEAGGTPVPLPAPLALLGAGLAAFCGLRLAGATGNRR